MVGRFLAGTLKLMHPNRQGYLIFPTSRSFRKRRPAFARRSFKEQVWSREHWLSQGEAGLVKCKECNANFINIFCNLSILLIWTLPEGFQIKEAYSTLERIKAEYTDNLEYGSLNNKVIRLTNRRTLYEP